MAATLTNPGLVVRFTDRDTRFFYGCQDKRRAQELIADHLYYHASEDRSKLVFEWVTQWADGKPLDPETVSFRE